MKPINELEFAAIFITQSPEAIKAHPVAVASDIRRMVKLAKELEGINLSDSFNTRKESRQRNAKAELSDLCRKYGHKSIVQDDSRLAAFGIESETIFNDSGRGSYRLIFGGK